MWFRTAAVLAVMACRQTESKPVMRTEAASTCWQILQCYTPCGTDAPCLDACLAHGDATAQAQVNAVIECTTHCNNEPGCVHDACLGMITACKDTGSQPHSTENLVPWLVGDWISTNYQFAFLDDGTVRRSLGVALGGGCASTVSATGPVSQEGDVLVMDFGPEVARNCNTLVEGAGAKQVRYRIDWAQGQLLLRELDCTKGGDLYCTERMTRR